MIEDYCDKYGLRFDKNGNIAAVGVTNISFTSLDTLEEEETQFDTQDETELALLWWEFCKENGMIALEKCIADYDIGELI